MYGNIPPMFDNWTDSVVHIPLLKSSTKKLFVSTELAKVAVRIVQICFSVNSS